MTLAIWLLRAWRARAATRRGANRVSLVGSAAVGTGLLAALPLCWGALVTPGEGKALEAERAALLRTMGAELGLSEGQAARVRALFAASPVLGQGNPSLTVRPMTREACRERRAAAELVPPDESRCGAPNMVPLYDPGAGEGPGNARACIDQYEFPNVACEYPVVHVKAREAALLCEAVGKRLCDAHEWEGACAGALRDPAVEYAWGASRAEMRRRHNARRERVWAYGPVKDHARCATASAKSAGCTSGWHCGSNTYPAGAFPACVSPFGAYDLHGNAAEHMNLPLRPEELASAGGYGQTEMKGSWFIFSRYEAHEDDCRWRAPDWHGTKVLSPGSHANYHLGFRCCKDVASKAR